MRSASCDSRSDSRSRFHGEANGSHWFEFAANVARRYFFVEVNAGGEAMKDGKERGPSPNEPRVKNRNEARDGSKVYQQVGVHVGDTAFHHNEQIYNVNQGDPPERVHEVALSLLQGGMPRRAEKLFAELVLDGRASTERSYYYILSVLGDRSFNDITSELIKNIKFARKICSDFPVDGWTRAVEVVWRLFRRMQLEFIGQQNDPELTDATSDFAGLSASRQDEITFHMDMILGGVVQGWLEARNKDRMVKERTSSDRAARVWKFFEEEPARPIEYLQETEKAEQRDWVRALFGSVAVVVGLVNLMDGPFHAGLLLDIPLLVAGGGSALWYAIKSESIVRRFVVKEREALLPSDDDESSWGTLSGSFSDDIDELVDFRFGRERPLNSAKWEEYAAGYRYHLKRRIIKQYGGGTKVATTTAALRWLIQWHAMRVAEGWKDRALFDHRETMRVPFRIWAMVALGVLVMAGGFFGILRDQEYLAALFLAPGAFFMAWGVVRIASIRAAENFMRQRAAELHVEEMRGYEEWKERLADRPTDSEIARWLAMDKLYLKMDFLRRAGLSSHDLVEHVVMLEGAPSARRGRVKLGPPRYEAYTVRVLLLTSSGVRAAKVHLDFITGEARNEKRDLFRYDALASARVTEKGMRTTHAEAGIAEPELENLRSRKFNLSLVNGKEISITAGSFRNWFGDKTESESELIEVAFQTSGIESALPILEAVAAEGRHWIERDQLRRKQWSERWDE
ncbi:hypothetical protein [Umezawaea sp. NPDC059074]|uniref:hypothetical protein n=1 Tax=Umezawaea sp. NPDC059074 TaxID=3346716 RepID=UPI0036925B3A